MATLSIDRIFLGAVRHDAMDKMDEHRLVRVAARIGDYAEKYAAQKMENDAYRLFRM